MSQIKKSVCFVLQERDHAVARTAELATQLQNKVEALTEQLNEERERREKAEKANKELAVVRAKTLIVLSIGCRGLSVL